MRENVVRRKLKRGEAVFGMMITEFDSPAVPIIMADAGLDFFILDMEHGAFTLKSALTILQTARLAGITPLIRVPDGMYHVIAPVLDAGGLGIVVPRVETREVAERSIAAMHYPPLGVRGIYGGKANNDYHPVKLMDYTRAANEEMLAIIQIESKTAVERAEELLATPGLDGVLVGPWDMASSLGVDPSDPIIGEMTQHVLDVAKRNKVACGIHVGDPAVIKQWQARGMTFLSCLGDLEMLRNSAYALNKALRG
ncbi:2-dehydro-3-deoxyglucarate aldolase [Anaerolineae bacterium]|nr:2-dehydro-3-deoxyglucarate aldolase [Anaerolineae bacterium]